MATNVDFLQIATLQRCLIETIDQNWEDIIMNMDQSGQEFSNVPQIYLAKMFPKIRKTVLALGDTLYADNLVELQFEENNKWFAAKIKERKNEEDDDKVTEIKVTLDLIHTRGWMPIYSNRIGKKKKKA